MFLRYPWRKPAGAWLLTTGVVLVALFFCSVWLERSYGVVLPPWSGEAMLAASNFLGIGAGLWVFFHQRPAEPGDIDYPDSW
jgi:hypothetical protein